MKKISFVIPCYRSAKTIRDVVLQIVNTVNEHGDQYDIILINDGSPDDTYATIKDICRNDKCITGISFSKNFGQHSAIMAGLRACKGEYIVCLDDDGQTPAEESYKLINALGPYDVAYAEYDKKKHALYRNVGSTINAIMTEMLLGKPKDLYISSFFAAKRFVIDEVIQYVNPYPYIYGLVLRTTSRITNISVNHREREQGKSGYTLKKLLSLWINGFTSFSVKPLRMATYLGLFTSFCGVIMMIYVILNKLNNASVPLGWSSLMTVILFLGGIIMTMLGLLGEYIGRIYICLNDSPQYVIADYVGNDKNELK